VRRCAATIAAFSCWSENATRTTPSTSPEALRTGCSTTSASGRRSMRAVEEGAGAGSGRKPPRVVSASLSPGTAPFIAQTAPHRTFAFFMRSATLSRVPASSPKESGAVTPAAKSSVTIVAARSFEASSCSRSFRFTSR